LVWIEPLWISNGNVNDGDVEFDDVSYVERCMSFDTNHPSTYDYYCFNQHKYRPWRNKEQWEFQLEEAV
jgi:hypothetical protein